MKQIAFLIAVILIALGVGWSQNKKTSFTTFEQSFVGQTGNIGVVTLFTPTADEDFEVTMYLQNVTPQNSSVVATMAWNDGVTPATGEPPVQQTVLSAGAHGAVSFPIHVIANTPVLLTATDGGTGQTFNLYVTALGF